MYNLYTLDAFSIFLDCFDLITRCLHFVYKNTRGFATFYYTRQTYHKERPIDKQGRIR